MQYPVPGLFCSLSTISMYCNLRAAVLLAYLRVLFLSMSISFIRHKPDKHPPFPPGNQLSPKHTCTKQRYPDQGFQFYFLLEYLLKEIHIFLLSRLLKKNQIV